MVCVESKPNVYDVMYEVISVRRRIVVSAMTIEMLFNEKRRVGHTRAEPGGVLSLSHRVESNLSHT